MNVGTITSPSGTITVGYSTPNITIDLAGGGKAIDSVAVQTGTSPVVPDAAGLITFDGAVVAAGTNPVRSDGTGANTYALEVQISQAIAATDATKIGLSNFDSARFTVDANGFVSTNGAGIGETITGNTGGALSPTAGNWNIYGGTVAAGTTPVATAGSGSTLTANVQISQAIAATDATKIGLSNFNSAHFTVDANGFVSLSGFSDTWTDISGAVNVSSDNGYFVIGTCTATLPASPSQGDTIKFIVDHASQLLTIQANTGQVIRLGAVASSAAGTAVSTLQGDGITLVYRSSDTTWLALSSIGLWNLA